MIDIIVLLLRVLKYHKKIKINAYNFSFILRSYFEEECYLFLDNVYSNHTNWHIVKCLIDDIQLLIYIK